MENVVDNVKISLCIPTLNRFDNFLNRYVDEYLIYANDGLIDEIIISDENGNDYTKLIDKYGENNPYLRIYKNENTLGVFLNKLKVCSYANNKFIALIDSDNFCGRDYFDKVKKYISVNNLYLSESLILSPSFAKPNFNYKHFENIIMKKENMRQYVNVKQFDTIINTGNYVLTKNITDNIKYIDDNLSMISACDVAFFNLLAFQQFSDLEFHIVKDLEYLHVVHNDSEYLKTHNRCSIHCANVYYQLHNM